MALAGAREAMGYRRGTGRVKQKPLFLFVFVFVFLFDGWMGKLPERVGEGE